MSVSVAAVSFFYVVRVCSVSADKMPSADKAVCVRLTLLHMLNHMKLLQSNVIHPRRSVTVLYGSFKTKPFTLMWFKQN